MTQCPKCNAQMEFKFTFKKDGYITSCCYQCVACKNIIEEVRQGEVLIPVDTTRFRTPAKQTVTKETFKGIILEW